MFRSGKGYIVGRDIAYPIVFPSPYPLPSVANHRLAPLIEAGDTLGVSYATHISIRPRGEGTLTTFIPI